MDDANGAAKAAFTIELRLTDRAPRVRSAVLRGPGLSHHIDFDRPASMWDAFAPDLAPKLSRLVANLPGGGPHRLPAVAHDLSVPGFVLGGLDITVSAPDVDGARTASLDFDQAVGGLQHAFAARIYLERPTLHLRETLGVRALEDVVTPLLNMASAIRAAPGAVGADRVDAQLRAIERRAADLEFHADLLRRYVADCAPDRARSPSEGMMAETGPRPRPRAMPTLAKACT